MEDFNGNSFKADAHGQHEKKGKEATVKNGVYIQDVNGKLWKTEDWDNTAKPNAIAVITPKHKFRIALTMETSFRSMHKNCTDTWENMLTCISDRNEAEADYDGANNTKRIMAIYSSECFAAGYCTSYMFPDGVTKGYLPALGELRLAQDNEVAIKKALLACGGTPFYLNGYWSSTFYGGEDDVKLPEQFQWISNMYGPRGGYRKGWVFYWSTVGNGVGFPNKLDFIRYVRAFAPLEL